MLVVWKMFHEQVGKILRRRYMFELDAAGLYKVMDVMMSNVDMLDLPMVFGVLCQSYSSLIVSLNNTWP